MLLLLLLLLLQIVFTEHFVKCPVTDLIHIPHDWYQEGDFHIGGIATHIGYVFSPIAFNQTPFEEVNGYR